MEKIKADILIKGNLICKRMLNVGGGIHACKEEELYEWFETGNSVVIDGDVVVDGFDSKGYEVVVCGSIALGGGRDGSL